MILWSTIVVGFEWLHRERGFRPMITDGPAVWARVRQGVSGNRDQVVLLGDSRMVQDFHVPTFRERFPSQPIAMLAISGAPSPRAVLRDLADDPSFRGLVLCGVAEWSFLPREHDPQEQFVSQSRELSQVARWEAELQGALQTQLTILNPELRPHKLAFTWLSQGWIPDKPFQQRQPDRSVWADYDRRDIEKLRLRRRAGKPIQSTFTPLPNGGFKQQVQTWRDDVERIKHRGGRVVLLRMPTSGYHWNNSSQRYPREQFWDLVADLTGAETIHFKDVPVMSQVTCPDESHLDHRQTPAVTAALLDELVQRNLLPPPNSLSARPSK